MDWIVILVHEPGDIVDFEWPSAWACVRIYDDEIEVFNMAYIAMIAMMVETGMIR